MAVQRKSARRNWLIVGGILTVAVLSLGVYVIWQVFTGAPLIQHAEQSSFLTEGTPQTVSVEGTSANVDLSGTQTDDVTSNLNTIWYSSEPVVDTTTDDSDLLVHLYCRHTGVPIWFAPQCSIDYTAQIPRSAGASVDLTSGDLSITDVSGAVQANSTSGRIELEFSEVSDTITAETVSGSIQVKVPQGEPYRVLTDSNSGGINVDVATDPSSQHVIDLTTTSGNITVSYSD